ncbi:MAG TPA: transposase [Pusillimonas sp.]
MDLDTSTQRPARRQHSKAFKARILRACSKPVASVAGIAVAHGLNPNMVQRWRREARRGELTLPDTPAFIPVVASTPPMVPRENCFDDPHR